MGPGRVPRHRRARNRGIDGCGYGRKSQSGDARGQRRIHAVPREADTADMHAVVLTDMLDLVHGQQRLGPDEDQRGEQRSMGDQASGDHRNSGSGAARRPYRRAMAPDGTGSLSGLQRGILGIIRQRKL